MLSFEPWVGKIKTDIITGEFVVISSNNKFKKKTNNNNNNNNTIISYYYYYHHFIYKDNHLIDQGDF